MKGEYPVILVSSIFASCNPAVCKRANTRLGPSQVEFFPYSRITRLNLVTVFGLGFFVRSEAVVRLPIKT